MIKHVVMWKLRDGAEGASRAENARRMKELLDACAGQTEGMRSFEVGVDAGIDGAPWDIVLVAEFEDRAALDAYSVNPVHEKAKAFIARVRDERAAVDYLL
jgi:quinol monooxygenase YgiN